MYILLYTRNNTSEHYICTQMNMYMYRDLVVHHDTYYLSVMNLTSLRPIRSVRMRLTNVVQKNLESTQNCKFLVMKVDE